MRRIERQKRRPAFLKSEEFQAAADEFASFHQSGGTRKKQGRSPLQKLLRPFEAQINDYLHTEFDGLCAYTEVTSGVSDEQLGLVWHRPSGNAINTTGDVSSEHYWWLALDWRNWYLASHHLDSVKGNSFPVRGERMAVPASTDPARRPAQRARLDHGLILDPCEDSPAFWLRFEDDGRVTGRYDLASPDRGITTIETLDLNNKPLRSGRATAIRRALAAVDATDTSQLTQFLTDTTTVASSHRTAVAQALIRRRLADPQLVSVSALRRVLVSHPDDFVNEFVNSSHVLDDYSRQARTVLLESAEQVFETIDMDRHGHVLAGFVPVTTTAPATVVLDRHPGVHDAEHQRGGARSPGVSVRSINPKTTISVTNRLNRIEIKNFRAIVHLVLELDVDQVDLIGVLDLEPAEREQIAALQGRPWKMLLGENGSGKSSVLHAIGLALCGAGIEEAMATADLSWDDLLRWQRDDEPERADGKIRLDFTGGARIDLRFDETGHRFHGLGKDAPAIHLNVRGYGAARFPSSKRTSTTAAELVDQTLQASAATSCNIDNLLDSTVPILNSNEWLGRLPDPEFNVAAETISDLLGESSLVPLHPANSKSSAPTGQRITRDPRDPADARDPDASTPPRTVRVDGERLSLVSDGYRSVIGLGCEIMAGVGGLSSASGGISDMREAEGIVLLDEIGAHLHPRWRMQITGKLRKAFPKVQFFVTTHEPLCLRGLVENEVIRVTKYERHGVLLDEIDRAPGRYRVDQLLTSEFFGLNSAIDPRVDRLFTQYYELKRDRSPSSAKLERIETLEAEINDRALRPVLGYTRRDQLIFEAIDDFLIGDALHASLPNERKERRAEIVTKVASIWKRFGDGEAS